jgi:menaquinol-cytochrome c reductase iron-sulfur subunit
VPLPAHCRLGLVTDEPKPSRRVALEVLAGVVGCGAIGAPAVRVLVAPASGGAGSGRWVRAVPLDSLSEGEPKRVELIADRRDAWTIEKAVALGSVWLVRLEGAVVAWSAACPHLGCAVDRSATAGGFSCPCHESAFAADGRRLTGPSPRDLDTLATRVEDGVVLIEFRRFRQGIAEKETVG